MESYVRERVGQEKSDDRDRMLRSNKGVYKHFVDQDDSLCAINLFRDNGVIEVAAPSADILYEGIMWLPITAKNCRWRPAHR